MSVTDGNYVFALAANTGLAMDVAGASDKRGTNVAVWTKHGRDSQIVHVTNSDGYVALTFPATGKALDVHQAKFVVGQNVHQWDWDTNKPQQKYELEEVEGGVVIHPLSYPQLAVAVKSATKDANLELVSYVMGDANQIWKLEEKPPASQGTYELLSKVNTNYALDVSGASQSNGAKVQCYGRNDTNAQKVYLTDLGNGRCKMRFCHSMRYLEVAGQKPAKGSQVAQYGSEGHEGNADNQWIFVPRGMTVVNGVTVTTYEVRNYLADGATLCLDIYGGKATSGGKVQVWPWNNSAAQEFALVPSEMTATQLPTPAAVGILVDGVKHEHGTCKAGDAYLSFECEGKEFKARLRVRTRAAGGVWTDWGAWVNASDGSSANSGWGMAGVPDIVFETAQTAKATEYALVLPTLTAAATDALELQCEVRSFATDWQGKSGLYAHSNSGCSGTIRLALQPTIAPVSVAATKDGLRVVYEGSYHHGGATVRVADMQMGDTSILLEPISLSGADGSTGTVLIPWSKLLAAPKAGQRVMATLELDADGLTAQGAVALDVTNVGTRLDPSCTVKETDHATLAVTVPTTSAADTVSAWVHMGDGIKMTTTDKTASQRVLDAFCPLGKSGTALVSVVHTDGSWGVSDVTLPAITSHAYVWDWDGGHAALDLGLGNPPQMDDELSHEKEEYDLVGREFCAYAALGSDERDVSVAGVLVDDKPKHGSIADIKALFHAGHAIFRNWRGEVLPVFVESVETPAEYTQITKVKVKQYQESR